MYVDAMDVLLHHWFTSYDEARDVHERCGGFLLPHRAHFFITNDEGIRILGLNPRDPDWEHIGWDWVRPKDETAFSRLEEKRWIAAELPVTSPSPGP